MKKPKLNWKWRPKYWWVVFGGLVAAIVPSVYFGIQNSASQKAPTNQANSGASSTSTLTIFPDLKQQDFYKFIRIANATPFIDDNMVARIVNSVLSKVIINSGNIKWNYYFADKAQQKLTLQFSYWPVGATQASESREYIFTIKN